MKTNKEKYFNFNTTTIKQNLLNRLQDSNKEKNQKPNTDLDNFKNLPEFLLEEKEEYSDREIEEQLNYILDPANNIKKEYQKSKLGNSCKCAKTGCMKFSCNCLRNNVGCDFLCSCRNCENRDTQKNNLLKKKTSRI
jgi:hypothetical protein